MAVLTAPQVLINGSNSFLNGNIYNVSYRTTYVDSPAQLKMWLISEDGTYLAPSLDLSLKYNIQIGTRISMDLYCVEYEEEQSPRGKVLKLIFIDGSFILDKKFVGLHLRHGVAACPEGCSVQGNLIVVGNEIHPCDTDQDGIIEPEDFIDREIACNPCPSCPDRDNTHCGDYSCQTLLDVNYNFNQLLRGMALAGIEVNNAPVTNDYYRATYDGRLRKVLGNWGADYGFNVFWENDKLNFIDTKKSININAVIQGHFLNTKNYKKSLLGTEARASISYLGRKGIEKDFHCEKSDYPILHCLTLKDLFGTGYQGTSSEHMENAVALSHYSSHLRDAYYWYGKYGMNTLAQVSAEAAKSDAAKTKMFELGDMRIMKAFTRGSAEHNDLLTNGLSKTDKELFQAHNGYFFLAERDEARATIIENREQSLADNFIGKYWLKSYTPNLCGGSFRDSLVAAKAPNGTVQYYKQGTHISTLPFTNFGYTTNGNGSFVNDLITYDGEIDRNIVLLTKESRWEPLSSEFREYSTATDYYVSGSYFHMSNARPDIISNTSAAYALNPKIQLFAGMEGGINIYKSTAYNANDEPKNVLINQYDGKGTCFPASQSAFYYGLLSNKCQSFGIYIPHSQSTFGVTLKTPSQSMIENGLGYRVQITQSYEEKVIVPKIQTIKQDGLDLGDNTLGFDVNWRLINDQDLNALKGSLCSPNDEVIQAAHNRFNKDLTFNNSDPFEEKIFTVAGIDLPEDIDASIANGLTSVDVNITDRSIQTSYTFANKPPTPPSENVIRQNIELEKRIEAIL